MMRYILFAHINPETERIAYILKKTAYAQEDSEIAFLDISRQECEILGVDRIIYPTNHYDDDIPYVWDFHPAHIASLKIPLPYMRRLLLNAMQRANDAEIARKLKIEEKSENTIREWACQKQNMLARFRFAPQTSGVLTLTDIIGDTRHLFAVRSQPDKTQNSGKLLYQMLMQQHREVKNSAQNRLNHLEKVKEALALELARPTEDDISD